MAQDTHSPQPVPRAQQTLSGLDLGIVWFGAAIAITEIWAGGLDGLTRLGIVAGLIAIVLGRVVGNGLMGLLAHTGAVSGLPTMVLSRPAFGRAGSYLVSFFNVIQLIGWTGFMLFVGAGYLDSLCGALGLPTIAEQPAMQYLWVGLLMALCLLWALFFGGNPVWKRMERISGVLLLLLTIAMTVIVMQRYGLGGLSGSAQHNPLAILAGMDLVIAMSVSWLPLVADYSRYARHPRAARLGTFWGYFIGGSWMYAVGLLLALAMRGGGSGVLAATPDAEVINIMGGAGSAWAIVAIVLVLLSTVTTTFLDIYSTTISAQNLWPRLPEKPGHIITGLLGAAVALSLSVDAYEPFLLAIGAVFLPAFTVVITDFWLVRRSCSMPEAYAQGLRWQGLLAWLVGFLVYDRAQGFSSLLYFINLILKLPFFSLHGFSPAIKAWSSGASIPCIIVSAGLYWVFCQLSARRKPAHDLAREETTRTLDD